VSIRICSVMHRAALSPNHLHDGQLFHTSCCGGHAEVVLSHEPCKSGIERIVWNRGCCPDHCLGERCGFYLRRDRKCPEPRQEHMAQVIACTLEAGVYHHALPSRTASTFHISMNRQRWIGTFAVVSGSYGSSRIRRSCLEPEA
jgi:hypothetical protein